MISIKGTKNVFGKFGRIAVRKEIIVDFLKLLDGQKTVRTVLEKPFVPLLDLRLAKVSELGKLAQSFGS